MFVLFHFTSRNYFQTSETNWSRSPHMSFLNVVQLPFAVVGKCSTYLSLELLT